MSYKYTMNILSQIFIIFLIFNIKLLILQRYITMTFYRSPSFNETTLNPYAWSNKKLKISRNSNWKR